MFVAVCELVLQSHKHRMHPDNGVQARCAAKHRMFQAQDKVCFIDLIFVCRQSKYNNGVWCP